MSRKDVSNISLKNSAVISSGIENSPSKKVVDSFETAEKIVLKSSYSEEDIKTTEHLDFAAGIPPYPVSYTHLTLPTTPYV